jgi:hypothetical protein
LVASIASYGSLNPLSPTIPSPISPSPDVWGLPNRAQALPAEHTFSNVAFAPAAMSALIEAQEQLSQGARQLDRARTVAKIDHLISVLADAPAAEVGSLAAPFAVRKLQTARQVLSLSPVDLQA